LKKDLDQIKTEILSRLNIQSEMELLGIKFVGNPNSSGWIVCRSPYAPDKHPSCGVNISSGSYRGYLCAFNASGSRGKPYAAFSFWDIAANFLPGAGGDFGHVLKHYAKKTGVRLKSYSPPKAKYIEFSQKNVVKEVKKYLNEKRGLTDESIKKYHIGWDPKRERNTFPVYDENGQLVNIRYHNSKKKPKTFNHSGYGGARIWGLDRLVKASPGLTIAITEGEWDSMMVEQETGLISVSPTNGKEAFKPEWAALFKGYHVVLVWDCDKEGRESVKRTVLPVFKKHVQDGSVLSIKVIWLFNDPKDKTQKDFTDFIVRAGGTGESLLKIIEDTSPYEYITPKHVLPDPISLSSFAEIDNDEYVGRRVTVPLYIYGENSEAYHAPTEVKVTHCLKMEKSQCYQRDDWEYQCTDPVPISTGNRILLSAVSSTDAQLKGALRDFVCDKGTRPNVEVEDKNRVTIRENFAHQVLSESIATDATELVEKPVYTIGGDLLPIGQYQATGFIHSHPRNQRPTMLIDSFEKQAEDWQAFDLDKSRHMLEHLQELSPVKIIESLVSNVTRIYEREEIHLGVLLTILSPLWLNIPGEGKKRGWISSIVIGDTGTGKTTISENIFRYAGIGARLSGMTSTRTGITYALEFNERRGWRIKAGMLLKMSKQALIIDEGQDIAEFDLKTMAEALDTGQLQIARVESRKFESMTRCFFSCNPVSNIPGRQANQRTMDSFLYPARSLNDIFPQMMLRRIDFCMFAASDDIKGMKKIYSKFDNKSPKPTPAFTSAEFKALVYYAWTLSSDRIRISDDIARKIRAESLRMTDKFGQCADLPIVYPQDFRHTLARLVVAYAVLDLASDDDFQTITPNETHIATICRLLDAIYSADNCRLDAYSNQYAKTHQFLNPEEDIQKLKDHLLGSESRTYRVKKILEELVELDPNGRQKLQQRYLADLFDVHRETILEDLKPFVTMNLIKSVRGYVPTTRLIRLWSYLLKNKKNFWEEV